MVTRTDLVNITPLAAEKLKGILEEQKEAGSYVRIIAMPGHNGGLQYMLALEKEPKEDDVVIPTSRDGVQLLVDAESSPLLEGASIDYIDTLMRSGFAISNPNFQGGGCACGGQGCGCGGH